MKSKTLALFNHYNRLLREQGEDMSTDPTMGQAPPDPNAAPDPSQDVTENPVPPPEEETVPLTSVGENELISNVVDAALFKPTPEQFITLQEFSDKLKSKDFQNARKDILTPVLSMISNIPQDIGIKRSLNSLG